MKTFTIYYGGEYMLADETGRISRPEIGLGFSDTWRITGAERLNNFGRVVESVNWEILKASVEDGSILWWHANGKQQWFVRDLDHGTNRVWRSPKHYLQAL